jgi:hypothetical protein
MKAKLACLAAPTLGILAILLWGGEPPGWLLRLEVLIFCLAALAFGFTLFSPVAPDWVFSRPVKGIVCIYLGIGAMFVPSQFIVSALFLGMGTRLLMSEFKPLTVSVKPAAGIARTAGDIVVRESGSISTRD